MKLDYYEILLRILQPKKFWAMLKLMKKDNNSVSDQFISNYCELILMMGISKSFRDDYIREVFIGRLELKDDLNNIYFKYKEYVDAVIKFFVNCEEECCNQHLYTELESEVEPYKLRYIC